MYDDIDEIDYDKIEENYRRAILHKENKRNNVKKRKKRVKVKFNPLPLTIIMLVSMTVVAVIAKINSKPKVLSVNKKIVDNVVVGEVIEEGKAKANIDIKDYDKINSEIDEINDESTIEIGKDIKTEKEENNKEITNKKENFQVVKSNISTADSVTINQTIPKEIEDKMPKSKAYTIQVSAGKSLDESLKFANELVKMGYPALCIKEGRFYKVLIGNFQSREEASKYGNLLLDKRVIKYFYPRYKK